MRNVFKEAWKAVSNLLQEEAGNGLERLERKSERLENRRKWKGNPLL